MVDILFNMHKYSVPINIYDILCMEYNENMFNLDIRRIYLLSREITDENIKDIARKNERLGLTYTNYELSHYKIYKNKIDTINQLMNFNFNIISDIILYAGYFNLSDYFEEPEFIKVISNLNINDNFIWKKVLLTSIIPSRFLYDDIYSYDYPTKTIQKNNQTILKYYSNIIEFQVDQVKICTWFVIFNVRTI